MTSFQYLLFFTVLVSSLVMPKRIFENEIFSDSFSNGILSGEKWAYSGNNVSVENNAVMVSTDVTDQGGVLLSAPILIDPALPVKINRSVYLHYGNNQASLHFGLIFSRNRDAEIQTQYGMNPGGIVVTYSNYEYTNTIGMFLGTSWASSTPDIVSGAAEVPWDRWVDEEIDYDPVTGKAELSINGKIVLAATLNRLNSDDKFLRLYIDAYGWWTGHVQAFTNISVTQQQ